MNITVRAKSLIFLGLALFATALIAVGLPGLELVPGLPLPDWEAGPAAAPLESVTLPHISVNLLALAILGIILGSTLFYLAYKFIQGASWKQMLSSLRFTGILIVVVSAVIFLLFAVGHVHLVPPSSVLEIPPLPVSVKGPALGTLPAFMIWLVWIGLGLVVVLLAIRIVLLQSRRGRNRDPLSLQAELALQALRSGEGFKNVIVKCYTEMSQILRRERGLTLEETMTAQEFKCLLEARGVPHIPIDQLTRLFEAARYGYCPPSPADEQAAYESLNAIISHIRRHQKVH